MQGRKLDLFQFRGDDDDDEPAEPVRKRPLELDALKAKTFSHGITKKTRKDLEREAEERKRAAEDEATRIALEEFNQAFEGPGSRARRIGPGGGFVRAGGAPMTAPREPPRGPAAMGFDAPAPARAPSPPPAARPRGKRAMDAFLEEIKSNQTAREARLGQVAKREGSSVTALAAREQPGFRSQMIEESTNVHILNLPPHVDEDSLGRLFAREGPVGTVKIMWPRGDDASSVGSSINSARRARAGLTGFVNFMRRADAERAVARLDGFEWGGSTLKVLWGKAAPRPAVPAYDLGRKRARHSRSPSPRRPGAHPRSRSRSRSPAADERAQTYWLARVPEARGAEVRDVADRVAERGAGYERALLDRERGRSRYAFLEDEQTPEHHMCRFYRDRGYRFPTPPPQDFDDDGDASAYSTDSAEDEERTRTGGAGRQRLGRRARARFESLLRRTQGRRLEIAQGMAFAVRRAEAADEIAEIVCQSLRLDGTPVPRKMARLHLVSDILHNSASPLPNVWKYRHAFERRLAPVFAHLRAVHASLRAYSGRIAADVFEAQVEAVLAVWERWIVFNTDVSDRLAALFRGTATLEPAEPAQPAQPAHVTQPAHAAQAAPSTPASAVPGERADQPAESKFKPGGFRSTFKPAAPARPEPVLGAGGRQAGDGGEVEVLDGEDLDGEDLDGEDLDGEDLDGEDLDGEGLDGEGLDGEGIGNVACGPAPPAQSVARPATQPAPADSEDDMEIDDDDDNGDLDGEAK